MQKADFRAYLQKELIRRIQKNPSYSLRSFADHLGIHHGTLSQILRGQRPLTKKRQADLAERLGLSPQQRTRFDGSGSAMSVGYVQLEEDLFNAASDWYHDAILELITLPKFQGHSKWISARLGITASEVNIAVERLIRLKLLRIRADGKWQDLSPLNTLTFDTGSSTPAIKKYQRQLLELSSQSVGSVAKNERSHTSIVFPISKQKMSEAEDLIRTCRRKLVALLKSDEVEPDSVYALQISLFPLTK